MTKQPYGGKGYMLEAERRILDRIFAIEGGNLPDRGYVHDPDDSGGETIAGVTLSTAREFGWKGDLIDLPTETIYQIYFELYIHRFGVSELFNVSYGCAEQYAEFVVHAGYNAVKAFQKVLNLANNRGKWYPDLVTDGLMGQKTRNAFETLVSRYGVRHVEKLLNVAVSHYYCNLTERREKDEKFFNGWLINRVK